MEHHAAGSGPAEVMVTACAASAWQAERHVYFGDPQTISEKLEEIHNGQRRRLYFVVVQGEDTATIYEYEHDQGKNYRVRYANVDQETAESFNAASERAMFETRGRSCVGKAIQATSAYNDLDFQDRGLDTVDSTRDLANSLRQALEHSPRDNFFKVAIEAPC